MARTFDVIVIGAGHAGVEAALASARMGSKTALINLSDTMIATMPCNPSIGGPAKGNLVREIDALGGQMSKTTDKTYLQMKLLNLSRGPAVRALRAQADKIEYSKYMSKVVKNTKNLTFIKGMVKELIVEDKKIKGMKLVSQEILLTKAAVITTGTYMASLVYRGTKPIVQGPNEEKTSSFLSEQLKDIGFKLVRLKTGTPPRIQKDTIDLDDPNISEEPGTPGNLAFSFSTKKFIPIEKQALCWLLHSTKETKKIIEDNLKKSVMYSGVKVGAGPRYCPSFEDKIIRFSTKECHQIFLEPESVHLNTIYVQGFSTSMPIDVQEKMIHSLPGMKKAKILKYAYAIEYDSILSTQLKNTLETKIIDNFYSAGQINGTSGYEEAASQGLIAGINASLNVQGKKPFIIKRNEGYIGVLIDDIVTKEQTEPYRMLTSRAEYRLLLRNDNAEERLKEKGHDIGLVTEEEWKKYLLHKEQLIKAKENLQKYTVKPNSTIAIFLRDNNISEVRKNITALNLLKRSEVKLEYFENEIKGIKELSIFQKENLAINIKYEGYVKKQEISVKRFIKLEKKQIPLDIDYDSVSNLANEARERFKKIKPSSVGQATRISGINPSDIQMLLFYLRKKYNS